MEKYGFIYIWYDSRRKMYYIGSHYGTKDDGYICSSNRMRDAYRRRPQDFRRRILKINILRNELLDEEYKWLQLIPDDELGKKYYNLRKHKWGHWSTDENKRLTVGEKISASPNRAKNISNANKGRFVTEETKHKLREITKKQFENFEMKQMLSNKSKQLWQDPEYKKKQEESRKKPGFYKGFRKKHTEETKQKMSENRKGRIPWNKGKILTHIHGTHWYTNGLINVKRKECPEGFWPGKKHKKGSL
jgi:hypothetical protein